MDTWWRPLFKGLTVLFALVVLAILMLATADLYFGGSKVRALYGVSGDALADNATRLGAPRPPGKGDAGVDGGALADAGPLAP